MRKLKKATTVTQAKADGRLLWATGGGSGCRQEGFRSAPHIHIFKGKKLVDNFMWEERLRLFPLTDEQGWGRTS